MNKQEKIQVVQEVIEELKNHMPEDVKFHSAAHILNELETKNGEPTISLLIYSDNFNDCLDDEEYVITYEQAGKLWDKEEGEGSLIEMFKNGEYDMKFYKEHAVRLTNKLLQFEQPWI